MKQTAEYVSKPHSKFAYSLQYTVRVEQVIASDGKPAVRVRSFKQQRWNGQDLSPECTGDNVYRFSATRPIGGAVGQWSDKQVACRPDACRANNDPSTYMDYRAWSEAFAEVYGAS